MLEKNFSTLWVEGEISNLSRPASGHIYFTLKDQQAQIRCAMFRNRLNLLRFRPANGETVQLRGSVSLYEARGDYQFIAEHMQPAGEGALQRAYEQLKKRLQTEGLFSLQQKRPLPPLPHRVGLITSPAGAAVHDILSVLTRRFPALPVVLYPTSVQGEAAVQEVVAAIQQAVQRNECDLLIITRGGGSLEDLWTFNEEAVARAIYHCPIPTLSAVGHETDITIADLVADQRAPTPSAAAESISPDQQQWFSLLEQLQQRMSRSCKGRLRTASMTLQTMEQHLRHPRQRIQQYAQRLDEGEQRLQRCQRRVLERHNGHLEQLHSLLTSRHPKRRITRFRECISTQLQQIQHALQHQLLHKQDRLKGLAQTLDALSPLSTLSRGYSITLDASQRAVVDAQQLQSGEQITTRLKQGRVVSTVVSTSE